MTSRLLTRIRARLTENMMIAVGGLVMGGAYLLAFATGTWQGVIPAAVAFGSGFALCHSTLQTRATELAPEARGTAISLFAFSLFIGSALGTAALGHILAAFDYGAVLVVSGAALTLVGVLAPRLTSDHSPALAS